MKKMTLFAAILALVGCGSPNKSKADGDAKSKKCLVIYYSQTGVTQKVAQEIAKLLDADIFRIEVEQPYSGTYEETIERSRKEMEEGLLPKLKEMKVDFTKYDVIFLGYPIWFGTYAMPIATLVDEVDFAGKKIVPFCTFGSGGLVSSMNNLKTALPEAEICRGYGVRTARIDKAPVEVQRFLKEYGYLDGEVEKLPEYSPQQPVNQEEIEIFNAACSGYKYPLGTPVSVGKRTTPEGTDYRFTAKSKNSEGNDVEAVIFVTVGKEQGAVPEFTEVVR